jgi:hypothetical protein
MVEGKAMSRNLKFLILLIFVLALAALAVVIASYQFYSQQTTNPIFNPFGRPYRLNPADLEFYYVARTVFSSINIILLIILIINYASIYVKTKSEFTIGLLLFASFFLMKDIAWSPFVVSIAGFNVFGLGPFAFLPDLFELVALSVLLYLSIKY